MTCYFDLTCLKSCTGIILAPGHQAIFTGTRIHTEQERYRDCELAQRLERENDLHFWFGETPRIDVYTVPKMELGGYDSRGGWFAGCPDFSLEAEPLYYIDRDRRCWRITDDSRKFGDMGLSWRERMVPAEQIRVFASLDEARAHYPIYRPADTEELLEIFRQMEETL